MPFISVATLRKKTGRRVRFDGECITLDDSSDMLIHSVSMNGVVLRDSQGNEVTIPVHPPGICFVTLRLM